MGNDSDKRWSGQSRGGRFGYLFFVYTIRVLGVRCAYGFLSLILLHFLPFAPKATRAIWNYNRKRLGYGVTRSAIELYRHYYLFGQTLIDKIAIGSGLAARYRFAFDNFDRFQQIIDSAKGVVMIGAHVGCWEAGAGFFGKYGKKINIVKFDSEDRQVKEVLDKNTEQANYKIIAVNHGSIEAMLQIKIALNEGEYVCFNGDRFLDRSTATEAEFLGAKALFPQGPFLIAAKCRVPVVFYYAMRESGRKYRFLFVEANTTEPGNAQALLQQYIESLEGVVKRYPRQWFNFYQFWNN